MFTVSGMASRIAALGGALLLGACAVPGTSDKLAAEAGGPLCDQINGLLLSGQRNSFGLRFAEAENAFAELQTIYSLNDVGAACPRAPSMAFILMNQALAYSSQERFVTADGLFLKAEELLRDGATIPPARLDRERALLTAYRAQDLLNRSSALNAKQFADAAAASFPTDNAAAEFTSDGADQTMLEISSEQKRQIIDEASNSHARAHILLLEGDLNAALDASNYALDLVNLVPRTAAVYRPRFLAERALIHFEMGELRKARQDAAESAQSFADLMPGSPLEARAQLSYGRALAALGETAEAMKAFERGFQIYEENPVIVEYKTMWPFFQIALAQREADPARAEELAARMFRAAQVIRRSITAATVSGAAALLGEGDGDKADAVRAWREAEEEFATLKALQVIQLQDPLNQAEQTERLAKEVQKAKEKVEKLREERDQIAPEYQTAINSPVSLADVQASLQDDEALVQIVSGEPRSLVFIIDNKRILVRAVRATEGQFAVLIASLRRAVQADSTGTVPVFRADFAHVLHNLLFGEIQNELEQYAKLVVSTTGSLQSFPVELLVTESPGSARSADWAIRGDYTGVKWLGARQAVSYVPSPRNLVDVRLRAGVSRAAKDVAAFGDFKPGVDPNKVLKIADLPDSCYSLARAVDTIGGLPGTAQEAKAISELFQDGGTVSMGEAFNEDALKAASESGELANFKVLHFATHGILWPTPDCFTDPALTVTATDSEDSDGLLTASEIRGFNLNAQLIVLSACNTASTYLEGLGNAGQQAGTRALGANGSESRALDVSAGQSEVSRTQASSIIRESGAGGESLSGLARAFFSAGARTVLATHWPVADAETTELMETFYAKLRNDNATFAEALREAQHNLRSSPKTSHPIFWGPFVLIGDGGLSLEGAPTLIAAAAANAVEAARLDRELYGR